MRGWTSAFVVVSLAFAVACGVPPEPLPERAVEPRTRPGESRITAMSSGSAEGRAAIDVALAKAHDAVATLLR